MTKSRRKTRLIPLPNDRTREHRARILTTLVTICENLEKLDDSPGARDAWREVIGELLALSKEAKPSVG